MLHHKTFVRAPDRRLRRVGIPLLAGLLLALVGAGCTLAPGAKREFKSSNVVIGTELNLGDSDYARQMAVRLSDRRNAVGSR